MKSAVCLLLSAGPSRFLAISRRNDDTRWGLPGGKVDPGESNIDALIREVREEVGFKLDALRLEPLYSAVCPGKGADDTYWVTTYLWKDAAPELADLVAEAGMQVQWMAGSQLCDLEVSPFAAYNVGVFQAYRSYILD